MYRKYTAEEKLNIVEGYLNGNFSLEAKAHELGYKSAPGCFKEWVRKYQEQGTEGLLHSAGNRSYTAEFKAMVVELLNTVFLIIEITKKQLLCMMFHTAKFILG